MDFYGNWSTRLVLFFIIQMANDHRNTVLSQPLLHFIVQTEVYCCTNNNLSIMLTSVCDDAHAENTDDANISRLLISLKLVNKKKGFNINAYVS